MILNEVPFHLFNAIHLFFTFLKVPDEVNHDEMVSHDANKGAAVA